MTIAKHVTKAGDVLDLICLKHYGSSNSELLATIIEKNYWLREYPVVLPAGLEILLPDMPDLQEKKSNTNYMESW